MANSTSKSSRSNGDPNEFWITKRPEISEIMDALAAQRETGTFPKITITIEAQTDEQTYEVTLTNHTLSDDRLTLQFEGTVSHWRYGTRQITGVLNDKKDKRGRVRVIPS